MMIMFSGMIIVIRGKGARSRLISLVVLVMTLILAYGFFQPPKIIWNPNMEPCFTTAAHNLRRKTVR